MPWKIESIPLRLRDAAYNNAAAAPDGVVLLARLAEESKALRARYAATMDLPYGPRERMRLDIFPGTTRGSPCLVYLHGGYWQMNSREIFAVLGAGVAAHGWSVAVVGYTLAPEANLCTIVGEVGAALDWLVDNRGRYGITGPLILAGSSAGGTLAALALEHPAVGGAMAISGIFELAPLRGTYLDAKLKLTDTEIEDLSPLRRPVCPKRLVIAHGSDELPAIIANAAALHALRRATGAPTIFLSVEHADHFSILESLRRHDSPLTDALLKIHTPIGETE